MVEATEELQNTSFKNAVILAGTEFIQAVEYKLNSWLPARKHVDEAFATRFDIDKSGEILLLKTYCPYTSHLYDIESENADLKGVAKYILFPDSRRG